MGGQYFRFATRLRIRIAVMENLVFPILLNYRFGCEYLAKIAAAYPNTFYYRDDQPLIEKQINVFGIDYGVSKIKMQSFVIDGGSGTQGNGKSGVFPISNYAVRFQADNNLFYRDSSYEYFNLSDIHQEILFYHKPRINDLNIVCCSAGQPLYSNNAIASSLFTFNISVQVDIEVFNERDYIELYSRQFT
jgi:hypothetical protein